MAIAARCSIQPFFCNKITFCQATTLTKNKMIKAKRPITLLPRRNRSQPSPFSANFDPSNPTAFLEKVFDFIASESQFLEKENAEKEVLSAVLAAKAKAKRVKEEKEKAEREANEEKKAAAAAATVKKEKQVEAKQEEQKKDKDEDKETGKIVS